MTQAEKKKIIKRLAQFKQDYNFTSKQIAEELQTTEAAISHWFNEDSLPRANKVEDIYKLFEKILNLCYNKRGNININIYIINLFKCQAGNF